MARIIDPVSFAQQLIRCPSVTPDNAGVLDVLAGALESLGFCCSRQTFSESGTAPVENLYAKLGSGAPNLCFAGHTDVVPIGNRADWKHDPFGAEIDGAMLYGRGAEDMKGAVAAFVAAVAQYIAHNKPTGSISLLITNDEEGPAVNGTRKMLEWMKAQGEVIDACIVGEPTNPQELGEMVKIGRRGSMSATLTVIGTQGHVAYPHLADNPVTKLVTMLHLLKSEVLDEGTDYFQPSNLEVVSVDVGNKADNVIPAKATATFNIRFNDRHTSSGLKGLIRQLCDKVGGEYRLDFRVSGEAFLTKPGPLSTLVSEAVKKVTGKTPQLSTTGGTSDARFIKDYCPVVEFGTTGRTSHKVDENVAVADLRMLSEVYLEILRTYFK
ncbi:MAG: succinyl-diaminopimelate desuccinylase [Alphaproteobacteria bacterium]|nr:succinyl-diaminopimelate desuccinylase [Alphaproteobacteria bacterium]